MRGNLEVSNNACFKRGQSGGPDFSSPAKWYQVSRQRVLVDTFNQEAIRRRMFHALALKQCVGIGDGGMDSDRKNDSSSSVKTDAVADTFKQN